MFPGDNMAVIPENVMALLNDPEAVKVLATVSAEGMPHAIVVGSCMAPSPDLIVAGEVMMKTTSANLNATKKAAINVVKGTEAYLITAEDPGYLTEGEIVDKMNEQLAKLNLKAQGVWAFKPSGVWNESASPDSGTKLA